MFKEVHAFSSFSVNDLVIAKQFYSEKLGLEIEEGSMGLTLKLAGGTHIFIYPKDTHVPATYTILNFSVDDIEKSVDELKNKEITLEHYEGMTDDEGLARGLSQRKGPDIAWFKDPAGNILSVMQEK